MTFVWLLPSVLLLWVIWRLLHQRDLALAYVRRWCAREQLQLLDDSVSFVGIRRWPRQVDAIEARTRLQPWLNFPRLVQQFRFEISSDGRERRQGRLLMYGAQILRLQVDAADGSQLIDESGAEW